MNATAWPPARAAEPRRRLVASVLLAAALHAVVLVGIDLPAPPPLPERTRPIELTLVGGIAVPVAEPQASPAPPQATTPVETRAPPQPAVMEPSPESRAGAPAEPPPEPIVEPTPPPPAAPDTLAGRAAIDLARAVAAAETDRAAALESGLRVRRLSDASPGTPDFAFYLDSWRRKVQRIGQLNYPRASDGGGQPTGALRLLATIAADGSLIDARVIESSGNDALDDAAVRIVRLAAPYAPFTERMRESADRLEIDRTWRFLRRGMR